MSEKKYCCSGFTANMGLGIIKACSERWMVIVFGNDEKGLIISYCPFCGKKLGDKAGGNW